jgi:opacity protein-like surface antigen
MVRAKIFGLAGAAALLSTAALAADLPPPLPAPVYRAPAAVDTGGWYLRGDVGVGVQSFQSFDFHQTNVASGARWPASWNIDQKDISDVTILGFGLGYAWNNWLRFDVTGEYRTKDKFKAVGSYHGAADFCAVLGVDGTCRDQYDGNHSATVVLANAYIDLGTWWCITPFIGAGVGTAYHKITGLTDTGFVAGGTSAFGITSTDHTQWNLAWAVHAGLAYNVSNNLKLEFSYRYLNMGNVDTAEILCGSSGCGTGSGPRAYYTLHNLSSQDFRLGFRWMLQPETPVYQPALVRKG